MKSMPRYMVLVAAVIVSLFLLIDNAAAFGADEWPRELAVDGKNLVLFQPEPEKLAGESLVARAAVSIKDGSEAEPVFGVVWFDFGLRRSPDDMRAAVTGIGITNIRFPALPEGDVLALRRLLEREVGQWHVNIDLERVYAALDMEKQREQAGQNISTDPPEILFAPRPTVLIVIDGEPRLKSIENSPLLRVVNTPFTLLFFPEGKMYYLYAGSDTWYSSGNMYDGWNVARTIPPQVAAMKPEEEPFPEESNESGKASLQKGVPPAIIVSTVPAELISTDGEPEYTPIRGTDLLYVSNTDRDILLHIISRQYYVLLAGRWYRSTSLNGPWTYVAGDDLPSDFTRIPEDSRMASILYAVPGTQAAEEAVLDSYVPTTAAVNPNTAALDVEYDGQPKFSPIRGTKLYYAANTAVPVIKVGRTYYACDAGIWFVASGPTGPWRVATAVPDEIYLIPPDSPVYHVTYVRIYDADPEVVYVGYTPGYTHSYIYSGTIVYGTGYHWPGWYGRYYYPRPSTWGYYVNWTPWYGWGYRVNYSAGSFRFSIGSGDWYRGSWWGPDYWWWDNYPYYYYGGGYRDYDRHRHWRRNDRNYRHRNLYRSKRNRTRTIDLFPGLPDPWPFNRSRSKGIPMPKKDYYEDRHDRPRYDRERKPRRPRFDGRRGPDEKWLQRNNEPVQPSYEPPPRTYERRKPPAYEPAPKVYEERPSGGPGPRKEWGTQPFSPQQPQQSDRKRYPEQQQQPEQDRRFNLHGPVAPRR